VAFTSCGFDQLNCGDEMRMYEDFQISALLSAFVSSRDIAVCRYFDGVMQDDQHHSQVCL
jgi:hypothetical protein